MTEQLIIDIDKNVSIPEYELILCKPNKSELCVINANNIVITPEFANIDELTFQVPLYIMDEHKKVKNPTFDLIKGDYLIQFNGSKYFIITNVKKESTESGEEYKSISCFSKEFELVNKNIVDYVADSRKLYDPLDTKDDNGLEWGIMNYIEKLTSWKIDYVKPSLMERRRSFNITRQNLIEVFKDIQTTYGCLFQFDTVNKLINIYEVTDLGVDRGLYISDENYIKSITEDIKHNEIKTRLFLYGRDNVSINKLNPTGTFYLDNFNFYKTTDYMSQELINALNNYDILLQSKQGEFEGYLSELKTLNDQLDTKETELFNLQIDLAIINDNIDTKIKNNQTYSDLNTQKENKQIEIDSKQSEINTLNSQVTIIENSIANLRSQVKSENNFTQEQLEELDYFIKEETYSDSNYTEENVEELYEKGQEILNKISQPPIEFSMDIVDFLSIVECQHDWDKLVLGDIVTIQHESLGVDIQVRLVGYSHDVDSNSLTLKFSNRNSIDDPSVYLKDLLSQMSSTSTQVDFSRFKWSQYDEDKKSDIILYVDSELDAARNKILAGRNQDVEVGERGIICKDPNNPNQQIRILNNIIAMTNDGWKTAKLAINANGQIVAEQIAGRLGTFAKIQANQIEVSDSSHNPEVEYNILDYIHGQTDELYESMEEFETEINNAFNDDKLTNIEANSLKLSYENMLKEAEDVISIAESFSIDTLNVVTVKNNLTTEVNKWINKDNYPLDISSIQRQNMIDAFTDLKSSINELSELINEKHEQNAKDYVDVQISELDGAFETLQNNIDDFSNDLKLTLAESNSLKLSLESLNSESTDLINVATNLNIDVEKTNYADALVTLTDYLNTHWLDKIYPLTITVEQRDNITNYFKDVESKKSILINKIAEIREENAKEYVDQNAIKKGSSYNGVAITPESGIIVQFPDGGFAKIGDGAILAEHIDGSYTRIDGRGTYRVLSVPVFEDRPSGTDIKDDFENGSVSGTRVDLSKSRASQSMYNILSPSDYMKIDNSQKYAGTYSLRIRNPEPTAYVYDTYTMEIGGIDYTFYKFAYHSEVECYFLNHRATKNTQFSLRYKSITAPDTSIILYVDDLDYPSSNKTYSLTATNWTEITQALIKDHTYRFRIKIRAHEYDEEIRSEATVWVDNIVFELGISESVIVGYEEGTKPYDSFNYIGKDAITSGSQKTIHLPEYFRGLNFDVIINPVETSPAPTLLSVNNKIPSFTVSGANTKFSYIVFLNQ